jgi:hypothetical protein
VTLRDHRAPVPAAAKVNPVTGKPFRDDCHEPSTVAHCESVLRGTRYLTGLLVTRSHDPSNIDG